MRQARVKKMYAFAVVNRQGEILRLETTVERAQHELADLLGGTDLTGLRIERVHVRGTTLRDIGRN